MPTRGFHARMDDSRRAMTIRSTLDRRYWALTALATLAAVLVLGIPAALVPNPVFGRMVAPEPFAYVVWIVSAPLIGAIVAPHLARPALPEADSHRAEEGSAGVTFGGLAAFLAIGCPVCNKIAVVALGVSGALDVFAPIQPVIGLGSVLLLAGTLAWRLRGRTRACTRCAGLSDAAAAPLGS